MSIDSKIQVSAVLDKATSHSNSNSFELEDVTSGTQRTESQPGLLTALFGGEADTFTLETNTVKYDDLTDTVQLPDGKAFDAYGPDVQKDKPRELIYEVGSYGIRANVAPQDYMNKRQPFTNELMDEAYLTSRMSMKMGKSWDLFTELAFAQLLTTDTNITRGGPMPSYNFYTDIMGGARPAAATIDLSGTTDVWQSINEQIDILQENVEKTNNTMTRPIILCGKNFFNKRLELEKQESLAREIRGTLDMQSMSVPKSNFGSRGSFAYQNFESFDGALYIRYSASITGTKLIGDNDAYLVPVGAQNFMARAYAPANTRTYVNTQALEKYSWVETHERRGVTMFEESNVLFMNRLPELIVPLTDAAP